MFSLFSQVLEVQLQFLSNYVKGDAMKMRRTFEVLQPIRLILQIMGIKYVTN